MGLRSQKSIVKNKLARLTLNSRTELGAVLRWLAVLAVVVALSPSGQSSVSSDDGLAPSVRLSPPTVKMGAFYNGARIRVEGSVPGGAGVLVVVRGTERDEFFNWKGRVGPIWVNADRVHITRTPSLFLSFSGAEVNSLLDRASIDEYQLDESAIKRTMRCRSHCKCATTSGHTPRSSAAVQCAGIEPEAHYGELIRTSYLALKNHEGRYQTVSNVVRMEDAGTGGNNYRLEFSWPSKASPGSYQVEVYACRERKVIGRGTAVLQVVEVGFPAWAASLAREHPWGYGALAVIVAVIAGFGTDAISVWLRRPRQKKALGELVRSDAHVPTPDTAVPPDVSEPAHRH
jgi:hypothetical protein